MTNLDRMKMLALATKDLEDAVKAYEKIKAEHGGHITYSLYLPKPYTKEAIKRRITQIRQDLLLLEKEL
jgi:transcription initiation factor IIE alpha subunit